MKRGSSVMWTVFSLALLFFFKVHAVDRIYYIAAEEIDWDFFPTSENLLDSLKEDAWVFLNHSINPPRIGHIYRKAAYREYTDITFTVKTPRPEWMGIIGPTVKAEVGDRAIIYFRNLASVPLSVHPHGFRYVKKFEGANYLDGTVGVNKEDDLVPPGGNYTYEWEALDSFAPTQDDPNCLTWMYHSHNMAEMETSAGLIGGILICKPGTLDLAGNRLDVDRELVLYFHVIDENESILAKTNLQLLLPNATEAELQAIMEDEDYKESNMMHSVNGRMYGSLGDLTVCAGDNVSIHYIGLGNEVDIHSIYIEGISIEALHHRKDAVDLFPANFLTGNFKVDTPIKSLLACKVFDHYKAGLMAVFNVETCPEKNRHKAPANVSHARVTRSYYIAAEEVTWDYGPSGLNQFTGVELEIDEQASKYFSKQNNHIGGKYIKAIFGEYTDANFITPIAKEVHLGLLGPTIYAEIGDEVQVVFKNFASQPYSLTPQGILVTGSHLPEGPLESPGISTGQVATYTWSIGSDVGPLEADGPCISHLYYSDVQANDIYAGLIGNVVVCRPGQLAPSQHKQAGIDAEFFLLFAMIDENLSPYLQKNIETFTNQSQPVDPTNEEFIESNKMHAINGYTFGNFPSIDVCLGFTVVGHFVGIGNEFDVHVAHVHGQTFQYDFSTRDTISIFPGITRTAQGVVDNPGSWAIDCRVAENFVSGMRAKLNAFECGGRVYASSNSRAQERVYYIAAVELTWNYTPIMIHPVTGESLLENEDSKVFVTRDDTHIGSTYKKAVFREFTDDTFTVQKPVDPSLGLIGPVIKAEVGDTLKIVFKNLASRNYSLFANGVKYNGSTSEPFNDLGVAPGNVQTYLADIPDRSGPGNSDYNCTTWPYFSAVDPVKDAMTGLIGSLVTCRPGTLNTDGSRNDVDKEFAILFSILDESSSWYLDENIQTYCGTPDQVDKEAEDFKESNLKHSINGLMYANLLGLNMTAGQRVSFYISGFGGSLDIHSVHFHGQTFLYRDVKDHRNDVINVFPDTTQTIELIADNPGAWLLHCHVNDHIVAGMLTTYTIFP